MKARYDEWMMVKAPALRKVAGLDESQLEAVAAAEVAASMLRCDS